jgi:hypothetical protein
VRLTQPKHAIKTKADKKSAIEDMVLLEVKLCILFCKGNANEIEIAQVTSDAANKKTF